MPLILAAEEYDRWLGDDPDPANLMRPFPADSMRMWPISTRVNKPENDNPSILEPIELATDAYLKPLVDKPRLDRSRLRLVRFGPGRCGLSSLFVRTAMRPDAASPRFWMSRNVVTALLTEEAGAA
jgi:hypothetical protein